MLQLSLNFHSRLLSDETGPSRGGGSSPSAVEFRGGLQQPEHNHSICNSPLQSCR
ncbi:hypothetical protein DPMN_132568 [Dreissena polymorpha]|uniref:Uncharacterized protein n=1 Tax=Dreissena polymorpha TaxID=45954 RepID=A0A9D4FVD3_DREPO|nr:hypothetical protein DPMN_132568 [Dreissena polymorpha]